MVALPRILRRGTPSPTDERPEPVSAEEMRKATSPETGEMGSVFDSVTLFRLPGDGQVPDYSTPVVSELERMVRTDTQVAALASALELQLRRAKWQLTPAEGDKGEAEEVEAMLRGQGKGAMKTPMELFLGQVAQAVWSRRAHFEVVWGKLPNGTAYIDKLAFRPPAACRIAASPTGELLGFDQSIAGRGWLPFRGYRSFVYVHGQNRRPLLGASAFDAAYQVYRNKKKVEWLTYEFLQEVSFPRRVGKYLGSDDTGPKALARKLRDWQRKGILALGKDEDVQPYATPRTTDLYRPILDYLDSQMARSVLVQFIQLGTMAGGSRGSQSLSVDQTDFYLQAMEAILMDMAAAITAGPVADYVRFNHGPDAAFPTFEFSPLQDEKKNVVIDAWSALAGKGESVPKAIFDGLNEKFAQYAEIDLPDDWESEPMVHVGPAAPAMQGAASGTGTQPPNGATPPESAPSAGGAPASGGQTTDVVGEAMKALARMTGANNTG